MWRTSASLVHPVWHLQAPRGADLREFLAIDRHLERRDQLQRRGCEAAIVAFVFMHLGKSGAIRACVSITLFVLTLIFALGGSDYATRDLHPAAWRAPVGQNS